MADATALIEMEVRTPHGEPVAGADVRITRNEALIVAIESAGGLYGAALPAPGDYDLMVARHGEPGGFEHRTLRATLRCSIEGGQTLVSTALVATEGRGAEPREEPAPAPEAQSRITEIREEGGAHRISILLDYLWFTPVGYPPTLSNRVDILVDGESSWASVAEALAEARRSIHLTTWIYQPTAELLRPEPLSDPDARAQHMAQRILEERARVGAVVRFLLWDAPVLSLPQDLRRAESDGNDGFQVLEEPNTTCRPLLGEEWRITNNILGRFPIGSFHQKTAAVDGRIGFCGGMNIKENDWDTRDHLVFDPHRCAFVRPASFRADVARHAVRPDHHTRHDFMARVEGPAVRHLEENFRERWNRLVERRRGRAGDVTPVGEPEAQPPAGLSQAQVVRTMPACTVTGGGGAEREIPAERGILDIYQRAIRAARRLIYIEDQYFRSTIVSTAIAEAIRAFPEIEVVVLTSERQSRDIFAGGWSRACFELIQRERPDFELYSLRVGALDDKGRLVLEDVDTHAKLLIVDDLFLLVGSANVNNRGYEIDGEIDIAVADPELTRRVREDLWREHLAGDERLGGGIRSDLEVWREHAERTRAYDPAAGILPASRIYPFVPRRRRWTAISSQIV